MSCSGPFDTTNKYCVRYSRQDVALCMFRFAMLTLFIPLADDIAHVSMLQDPDGELVMAHAALEAKQSIHKHVLARLARQQIIVT